MRFNFPVMGTVYEVIKDGLISEVQVTVIRDLKKAQKSLVFKQPNLAYSSIGSLTISKGSTFTVMRLFDGNIRLEILTSPERYLQRVKFYTNTELLGNLEIEPCK